MPLRDQEARRRYRLANKERDAARQREYREANKEKLREYNRTYEATHKERRRSIDKRKDPQKVRARQKLYRARNKEKFQEYDRKRQADPVKKAIRAEQSRKRRALDLIRARKRDNHWHQKRREAAAFRPKPDACEICAATHRKIMWDHCHQMGHFRGWICQSCNIALGQVQDSIPHLLKLIAYIERNRTNTAPQLTLSGI